MSPDETVTVVDQEPTQEPQTPQVGESGNDSEIAKLRAEAAKWRTQFRDAQKQVKEYQPLAAKYSELEEANKGEAQKLADSLAAMQTQLAQAQANATRADNERKLTVLATKAGVPADMLNYLDVTKFDLDDADATLEALSALVPAKTANSGAAANPARQSVGVDGLTPAEWYKQQQQGGQSYIFGDK